MVFDLSAVRNLHFTMAKPWDLRHPCHKGFERLNQLWHAAYAEPRTLGRALLQAHLAEKRGAPSRRAWYLARNDRISICLSRCVGRVVSK